MNINKIIDSIFIGCSLACLALCLAFMADVLLLYLTIIAGVLIYNDYTGVAISWLPIMVPVFSATYFFASLYLKPLPKIKL